MSGRRGGEGGLRERGKRGGEEGKRGGEISPIHFRNPGGGGGGGPSAGHEGLPELVGM